MAFGRRAKATNGEDGEFEVGAGCTSRETFLDVGSELAGELRFAENVRLEGRVEGQIRAGKTVVVGESAEIDASIEAETLEVHGTVIGDIHVLRQTRLHKTARVEGEIQTAGIIIEEGARFKGCIVIGPDEDSAAAARPVSDLPAIEPVIEPQLAARADRAV